MRGLPVDSHGKFLNNKRLAHDEGARRKCKQWQPINLVSRLKIRIAHDYVTEKFFDPLTVGSGTCLSRCAQHRGVCARRHCFINAGDFPNPRALAEYLQALLIDDTAYTAYFAWKQKPFHPQFIKHIEIAYVHSFIRLAEYLHTHPLNSTAQ